MGAYVELHAHSYFSLLDGAASPEALVERAAALGMPALALTDHDGLYGAQRFYSAAREHGLHALIGAELTLDGEQHLTLLAESRAGYANLCRLVTLSRAVPAAMPAGEWQGKRAARVPWGALEVHHTGLIALSGCRLGPLSAPLLAGRADDALQAAARLREIFGPQYLYVELQRHLLPDDGPLLRALLDLARRLDLPIVATNDVHYVTRAAQRLQDVLVSIRHLASLDEAHARGLLRPNDEYVLKSPEEMERLFAGLPQAVAVTREIAARCQLSLDFGGQRAPTFDVPAGHTSFSYLYTLCQQGLQRKFNPVTPRANRQLAHELDVVERTGLADFFLVMWDIVQFAQKQGIRYQGRGSAANSLVAYLLDITPVDPLRFDLLFERFLSEDRHSMPDIDVDFAADRREEVIQYVYARYGAQHTAMVCNVNTFQARSARRDVARCFGLSAPDALGEEESAIAAQLEDVPRHLSIHVGGMLITAAPITDIVPVEPASMPGRMVVQWDKDSVEDAGLIKIDLLALRTLGVVDEVRRLAENGRAGAGPGPLPARPSEPEPEIFEMLCRADTLGAFQVESRAQMQMLPRLKPRKFEDLVVAVALVRPGPIQGNMVHPYLRRRDGLEPVTYAHPALEAPLRETLGVILFQEQVLRVAMAVAGFSGGEADRLRRAMSRDRSNTEMARLRTRFVTGACANGMQAGAAEEVFEQLAAFASYGFCKSHAAAFAGLAYETLWLKLHYPAEFYCALLNQQPMGFYSPSVVAGDALRHGVRVLHADVNLSAEACTLERPCVRLGLRYVKGFGPAACACLLAARAQRPFADLPGLCRRTRLPRALVENLVRAGALDSLRAGQNARRTLLWELGALDYREETLDLDVAFEPAALPDLNELEEIHWEYELLGMAPGDHVMRLYRARLRAAGILSAADLAGRGDGANVRVAGQVVVHQRPPTAKGVAFLTLEDETGLANVIIRPDLYERRAELLRGEDLLSIRGRLQRAGEAYSVVAYEIAALGPR